jgi:hypothetical protein
MADPENEIVQEWIEHIPDPDRMFMRVHAQWLRPPARALHAGVFREIEGAISTDWEKYSSAQETRSRAKKNPSQNGVIALVAGDVRGIEGLSVEHEPIRSNRAHSGIHGLGQPGSLPAEESKTKRRVLLLGLVSGWEIDPFETHS